METILSSSAHMKRLVGELSDFASAGEAAAPEEPANAAAAALDAVRSLQGLVEQQSGTVKLSIPSEATVRADPLSLERVFQNLISNALKFGADEDPQVEVTAERVGEDWRFDVTDNGEGVEESEREVIFQPFRRAKGQMKAGSGLGLSICRKTVDRFGGSLGLEPQGAERGSRFYFTLPAG